MQTALQCLAPALLQCDLSMTRRWPSHPCSTSCMDVCWVQGSNAHVVAEVFSDEMLALVHALPSMPWRRARAWCIPESHLLLRAAAVAASACLFTAPVSHPSLAGLRSCCLAGSGCSPAVGLEARLLI